MRRAIAVVLCLLMFGVSKRAFTQEQPPAAPSAAPAQPAKMTNADVIELVGMSLSDELIIDKIYAAKGTDFDTSVPAIRALKAAKVSDGIIRVMINPLGPGMPGANAAPEPSAPQVAAQPQAAPAPQGPPPPPPGPPVYFKSTDGKIRIYVTDHPINEFISVGRSSSSTYANANHLRSDSSSAGVAHAQVGDDPRTVEIQADVQKLCPRSSWCQTILTERTTFLCFAVRAASGLRLLRSVA